jgi:ribosomal protein L7Ae-like RNA K-turn-binding protein
MIGMAQKAGKLTSGGMGVIKDIRSRKSKLVIIAGDSSDNTKKQFADICKFSGTMMLEFGTKEELGHYIGKGFRAAISIRDKSFADSIIKNLNGGEIND